jgi:hypothetical protein
MAFIAALLGAAYFIVWLIVVAAVVAIAGDVIGLWDAVEFV